MGSQVMDKVPIIDFGKMDMKAGSEEWNSVRDQVYKALEEYGCFEAIIDATLIPKDRLYDKLKEVFSLPLETKLKDTDKSIAEYFTFPLAPLYERMTINHVLNPDVVQGISNTLWPNGQQEFCDVMRTFSKRLFEFDELVRRMIFDKLGLRNFWDDYKNPIRCDISTFKYRVPNADETNVGLPAHTDKLLSITLSQDQVGVTGLQVRKRSGQWLDVEFSSPHSYLFLVNDCLTALTNGRLHNPHHRVIIGDKGRYSSGVSTTVKGTIKVPDELVDEIHPLLYKPFDATKYFEYCISNNPGDSPKPLEINLDARNTLKTFCGA